MIFRYKERANIEELFFVIQTKRNAYRLRPYCPPDGKGLKDINIAWQQLEKGEHQREIRLREELARYGCRNFNIQSYDDENLIADGRDNDDVFFIYINFQKC